MVEAVFPGRVIARSEDTVVLEGNHYFPPGAVDEQYLHSSGRKSAAQVDGSVSGSAAWTYRHAFPPARRIKNHVAFWGDVTVHDTAARTR